MHIDINGPKVFFTFPLNIPILGDLQISETMVVSWIVMIIITGLCIWLTHDLKVENISKRQAAAEMIVETLNNFVVGNMGEKFRYMIPVSYTHLFFQVLRRGFPEHADCRIRPGNGPFRRGDAS